MDKKTLDIPELARLLGISRNACYIAARQDLLPVPVIRIGKRLVVPRAAVEQLLGGVELIDTATARLRS